MENKRRKDRIPSDYKFFFVLYPDSDKTLSHGYDCVEVLDRIKEIGKRYAFILHDQDTFEDGSSKSKHYHVYLEFPAGNKMSTFTLAEKIGVSENYLDYAENIRKCIRYLCHLDDPEKFQYMLDDVEANFDFERYCAMSADLKETSFMRQVREMIRFSPGISFNEVADWAIDNGYARQLRQYHFLIKTYMNL